MGINLVIGCHRCREKVWMYRGKESHPLLSFYNAHWGHRDVAVELADDQSDKPWIDDYVDVGQRHGVEHREMSA